MRKLGETQHWNGRTSVLVFVCFSVASFVSVHAQNVAEATVKTPQQNPPAPAQAAPAPAAPAQNPPTAPAPTNPAPAPKDAAPAAAPAPNAAVPATTAPAKAPVPTPATPSETAATPATVGPPITGIQKELNLQVLAQQGGPVLWVIGGLGFLASVLALYLLMTVSPRREAPVKLIRRVSNLVRSGDVSGALLLCENRNELAARVLSAGLTVADQERYIIQEAMEGEGARGITELWQRISYLNNIGVIAPLLGLLGTVWGMIGAFNTIATDNSQAKGIAVAYYVSMAMITTAGGLVVAIPSLLIYYYLRGRVVRVIAHVETQAAEFVELLCRVRAR